MQHRKDAIRQLRRIARDQAYRSVVGSESDSQTVELVATVTRWRRWIDFQLSHFSHKSPDRLEPLVAEILRAGIAELAILRTPPYAAVHSWVAVARTLVRPQATRLINGLLRQVAEHLDALPEPNTDDSVRNLAIQWSHPTWLARRYAKRFGLREAKQLMEANNRAPKQYIRVNNFNISRDDFERRLVSLQVEFSPAEHLNGYYQVSNLGPIIRAGMLKNGMCAVHDQSAGLVVRLLDPQPGETILDACAAPGGKTCQTAQRMQDRGKIVAWDRHEGRAGRIKQMAQAHKLQSITVACQDLQTAERSSCDRVLVDVPCTGTGVLAKRADLRWNRTADDLGDLIRLQDALLEAASRHVRPGGTLVYSTCSIEPEENEDRVATFLEGHAAFRKISAASILPSEVVSDAGYLATLPHRHLMDGAFAACLKRRKFHD